MLRYYLLSCAGSFRARSIQLWQLLLSPAVVPEFKSITVGGAYVGIGIASSSFKFGLVHENIIEAEVLLADGSIVIFEATIS